LTCRTVSTHHRLQTSTPQRRLKDHTILHNIASAANVADA
jgi:hypothetical protein